MTKTPREHALLDLEMRRRLLAVVRQYPGLHIREAARQLDTSMALVEYHVSLLEPSDLLRVERGDRYARLYAAGARQPNERERRQLAVVRQRIPLQVTLYVLDRGASKHGDIAEALDLSKSKLSFHLRKLETAGVIHKLDSGLFDVPDAKAMHRLLTDFPPTTELRNEFAALWLKLYGSH